MVGSFILEGYVEIMNCSGRENFGGSVFGTGCVPYSELGMRLGEQNELFGDMCEARRKLDLQVSQEKSRPAAPPPG
eukprot:COSAG01_NODE_6490_length_3633_cov_24.576401_5_plen_76_part_00